MDIYISYLLSKSTQTGNIASLASNQPVPKNHSNYQPLKEVLDTSIVTKEVEQILAPLEKVYFKF